MARRGSSRTEDVFDGDRGEDGSERPLGGVAGRTRPRQNMQAICSDEEEDAEQQRAPRRPRTDSGVRDQDDENERIRLRTELADKEIELERLKAANAAANDQNRRYSRAMGARTSSSSTISTITSTAGPGRTAECSNHIGKVVKLQLSAKDNSEYCALPNLAFAGTQVAERVIGAMNCNIASEEEFAVYWEAGKQSKATIRAHGLQSCGGAYIFSEKYKSQLAAAWDAGIKQKARDPMKTSCDVGTAHATGYAEEVLLRRELEANPSTCIEVVDHGLTHYYTTEMLARVQDEPGEEPGTRAQLEP